MSTHRARINRRTAEQMLRGQPVDPHVGADPLVELLAAAAAPAAADPVAGEQAALAAFRAARLGPVHQPRRPQMIKSTLAKLLTVKAAAAIIATTAVGGVALAASSGALPNPLAGPNGDGVRPTPAHATGQPADAQRGTGSEANPSPSMVGLCRAYTAGVAENPGKALDNPAFTALITEAGGEEEVADFCETVLLEAGDKGGDSQATTDSGKSSTRPTPARTVPTPPHPTGKPTAAPTN